MESFFREVLLDDETIARQIAGRPEPDGARNPRLSDWSPTVAAITDLRDRVTELTVVTARAYGGKAQMQPALRPVTALDRIRKALRWLDHQSLVDRMVPKK